MSFAVAHASPVIDDAALEKAFIQGLLKPGVDGMEGASATKALAAAEGKLVAARDDETNAAGDYERACRSVVVVGSIGYCRDCHDWHMDSVSTGWILGSDGLIVTNYHVVEDKDAGELGVMTFDGKVYPVATIHAADREGDAAILGIDLGDGALPTLSLARGVRTGEAVRVVGHPDGRFYSLTEGIVSRVFTEATSDSQGRRTWVSITADYGSGSSGAPVLNDAGEVVAVVSSTAALLADREEDAKPAAEDVQMVFKDCVSPETIRRLLRTPDGIRQ
jgi:S1-C subfamily serine protease